MPDGDYDLAMSRWRKWLWRSLAFFAMLLAVLFSIQLFVLPGLVRSRIHATLHAAGLEGATVDVEYVGWTAAHIGEISLPASGGGEAFELRNVTATYSPGSLARGRLGRVTVATAHVPFTFEDGKLDLGALGRFKPRPDAAREGPPMDAMRVHLLTLGGTIQDQHVRLVFTAEAQWLKNEQWRLKLRGGGYGGRISLSTDVQVDGRSAMAHDLVLKAELDPLAVAGWPLTAHPAGERLVCQGTKPVVISMMGGEWSVKAPGLHLEYDSARIPGDGGQPFGLRATARFAAEVAAHQSSVTLIEPATVSVGAVGPPIAPGEWRLAPSRWSVEGVGGPVVSTTQTDQGRSVAIEAQVISQSPVHASHGPTIATGAESISARLALQVRAVSPHDFQAMLDVEGGTLTHSGLGLELAGVRGTLPLNLYGSASPEPREISIESIRFRDQPLPSIHAMAAAGAEGLDASFRWPLTESAAAEGTIHITPRSSELTARLPSASLVELRPLLGRFVDLNGVELGGRVTLDAQVRDMGGDMAPVINVALDDGAYRKPESGIRLDGIHGNLVLNGVAPITTPGGQRLSVARYQQGKIILTEGGVQFRLEADGSIFVERTDWTIGESGRVTAHAVRYHPQQPRIETELFIDDLNLEHWLSVLTNETVVATGRLYGRVPLRIRTGPGPVRIAFGEGFLYSAPGTGTLQFPDAQEVSTMLAQADPRFTTDDRLAAVRQNLADALTDMEYSMFRSDLIPRTDGSVTLQMEVRGRGRKPPHQEIGSLTVNFNGFGTAANFALTSQQALGAGLERRLQEFFKPIERTAPQEGQP